MTTEVETRTERGALWVTLNRPQVFNALTAESEEGFMREKFIYGVRARYRLTYGYWQHAVLLRFA